MFIYIHKHVVAVVYEKNLKILIALKSVCIVCSLIKQA